MQYKYLAVFFFIAIIVCAVYSPSLRHFPRGDQFGYLAEINSKHSLWDLTVGCLDLNRTRQFNYGDQLLFRPVVFLFLGAEQYLFGYNYPLWQAVGIILHLAAVFCLLILLMTVQRGWPAVWFTAFFALLFVNIEMVTWQHVNAYMVFVALFFIILRYFYLILDNRSGTSMDYFVLCLCLLMAVFTYEMSNIMALVMGAVLWSQKPRERRYILWILLVPFIYLITDVLNAWAHPFDISRLHGFRLWDILRFFKDSILNICFWFYLGLFQFKCAWNFGARTMPQCDPAQLARSLGVFNFSSFLSLGVIGQYAVIYISTYRSIHKSRRIMAGMALGFIIIFAGIILLGREMTRGIWEVLLLNMHYMYIFWAMMVVFLFVLVDWSVAGIWSKRILGFLVACLILLNACKIYEGNSGRAQANKPEVQLVWSLQRLIQQHGLEPGFSFYVDPSYPGNFYCENVYRRNDPPGKKYILMDILFPEYFKFTHPKYRFKYN